MFLQDSVKRTRPRPPPTLRTKTGCFQCRKRKKKCDESRPRCNNCTRLTISCDWPLVTYPAVRSPTEQETLHLSAESSPLTADLVSEAGSLLAEERAIDDLSLDDASLGLYVREGRTVTKINRPKTLCPWPRELMFNDPTLGNFFWSVFLKELVHPITNVVLKNSHGLIVQRLANYSCVQHALLAGAGTEITYEHEAYQQVARRHYVLALRDLRDYLADGSFSHEKSAVAVCTTAMLCIFEGASTGTMGDADTHLTGMATLVSKYLQSISRRKNQLYSDGKIFEECIPMETLVYHAATVIPSRDSVVFTPRFGKMFDLAIEALEDILPKSKSRYHCLSVLAAPPLLFSLVRRVGQAYREFQRAGAEISLYCEELDQEIELWQFEQYQIWQIDLSKSFFQHDQTYVGPMLYVLASRLLLNYIIRSSAGESHVIDDNWANFVFDMVESLWPTQGYFMDYYCWPFFCLTIALSDHQRFHVLPQKMAFFLSVSTNGRMKKILDMCT